MGILPDEGSKPLASETQPGSNLRRTYPGGLLMLPVEIEAFVGGLTVREARIVKYLFHMIENALSDAERYGLTGSDICVVRELANAYDCESYVAFMRKLIVAVDEGREGEVAAYNTVRRADDLLHTFPADQSVMRKILDTWTRVVQSVPPEASDLWGEEKHG